MKAVRIGLPVLILLEILDCLVGSIYSFANSVILLVDEANPVIGIAVLLVLVYLLVEEFQGFGLVVVIKQEVFTSLVIVRLLVVNLFGCQNDVGTGKYHHEE